jgi:tetratricopeptide (TPR) repeat protein
MSVRHLLLPALTAVLLCAAPAPAQPNPLLTEGFAALKAGNHDKALKAFDAFVAKNQTSPEGWRGRGLTYLAKGKLTDRALLAKAEADLKKSLELEPKHADTLAALAEVYNRLGKHTEALVEANRAIEQQPKLVEAYGQSAWALRAAGKLDEALKVTEQLIAMAPKNARGYYSRANVRISMKQDAEAADDLAMAEKLNDKFEPAFARHAALLATTANAKLRDGQLAAALAVRACELSNYKNPHYFDTAAQAYASSGAYKEAAGWEKRALDFPAAFTPEELKEMQQRLKTYESKAK